MASSRKFLWVWIDRDKNAGLPEKFQVSAYPTILALNPARERIHRFSGFREAKPFLKDLEEIQYRWGLWKDGKDWDVVPPRPDKLVNDLEVSTLPAPGADLPAGIQELGPDLWVASGGRLHRLDPATGEAKDAFPIVPEVQDLATDGEVLYGAEFGWSAGGAIRVIDPKTGAELRTIATEANKKNKSYSTRGIAWKDGKLWLLSGMEGVLEEVDPKTGEIASKLKLKATWLSGLDYDGTWFVSAGAKDLYFFDPKSGEVVHKIPVNYPLKSVAAKPGTAWAMEQPVFDFDRQHQRVRTWPKKDLIHRISLPKISK